MPCVSAQVKKGMPLYKMLDKELIDKIRIFKIEKGYTLYELSKLIDIQVSTLERWLKTGRINRIYAKMVKEKLNF